MSAIKYFTGKPCKHGHIAERFASTKICVECNRINARNTSKLPKARQRTKQWHVENPERVKEISQDWSHRNKKVILADTRLQQSNKLLRTPIWAEKKEIKEFYKNCPVGYEVDHIIPLQGKIVSGLHVLGNLQYLTRFENRSKGNAWSA